MDGTPNAAAQLEAMRGRSLGWSKGLGELIDNPFDAGATRIDFGWDSPGEFWLKDNGPGCETAQQLVKLGEHVESSARPRLGRYGIGAKDMFTWLWGQLHIESRMVSAAWAYDIDWSHQVQLASWKFPDQSIIPVSAPTGLFIRVSKADHKQPARAELLDMLNRLAFTYTPALSDGAQIICWPHRLQEIALKPVPMPPLSDVLDTTVRIGERTARVKVGIVEEGSANSYPGFSYAFQYRVIKPKSIVGCGTYSSARIAGWVELVDDPSWNLNDPRKWKLTTNKDDFFGADELGDLIAEACEPLLKKASEQPRYANLEDVAQRASRRLNRILQLGKQQVKGRRQRREKAGTHTATGEGPKPQRFENSQPEGPVPESKPRKQDGGLRIEIVDFNGTNPGLGETRLSEILVRLNKTDKHVARALTDGDERAIANTALTLFFAELQTGRLPHVALNPLLKGRDNDEFWFARKLSECWQ